jgi:hypothetical protein
MENNNTALNIHTDTQFTLSYELLSLLQWMVDHNQRDFKRIIAHALRSGLKHDIQECMNIKNNDAQALENAQHCVIDFFGTLEALIAQGMHEQTVESALEKNLMPALDHIDTTACDKNTVLTSIEKATTRCELNPHENPQDLMFKELLKRWKPSKKSAMN